MQLCLTNLLNKVTEFEPINEDTTINVDFSPISCGPWQNNQLKPLIDAIYSFPNHCLQEGKEMSERKLRGRGKIHKKRKRYIQERIGGSIHF